MGIMLFLVPALVIYLVFQIIPIIGSIYFSLVDWNGIAGSSPKFVGLKNYIDAFHNADFILSFKEHGKNGHHQCDLSYPDRTSDGSCDQYKV